MSSLKIEDTLGACQVVELGKSLLNVLGTRLPGAQQSYGSPIGARLGDGFFCRLVHPQRAAHSPRHCQPAEAAHLSSDGPPQRRRREVPR